LSVPPREAGQVDFRRPAIAIVTQINLFILEVFQQPIHHGFVVAAPPSRPLLDLDPPTRHHGNKATRTELTALLGVEVPWLATTFQCHIHAIETELRFIAPGELPSGHFPAEEIYDRLGRKILSEA
jgi:hypothetical protein